VLDCNGGVGELEGKLFTKTVFIVAVCSIAASVPAWAQDEARIFQYSPIAQLVGEGQYRAEIWRRENASGEEERAWSSPELLANSVEAMAAACAALRETYAYSCAQASRAAKAGETVKGPGTAVIKGSKPAKDKVSKAPPTNSPVPVPKAASAASKSGSNNWEEEFWTKQSRFGGGSGGGGGSQ